MIKTTIAAIGMLGLLAGVALAAPAPNDFGVTARGGGVYYNPYLAKPQLQPVARNQKGQIGTTGEGGGIYQDQACAPRG